MYMARLGLQRQLLKRVQRVVKEWPADPSRKGRDLGEFLKESYVQRVREECVSNVRPLYSFSDSTIGNETQHEWVGLEGKALEIYFWVSRFVISDLETIIPTLFYHSTYL